MLLIPCTRFFVTAVAQLPSFKLNTHEQRGKFESDFSLKFSYSKSILAQVLQFPTSTITFEINSLVDKF